MKLVIIGLMIVISSFAQAAGTVTQNTTTNVVGTAGTLVCTLTNTAPALPSGVHIMCTSAGVLVLTGDSVIPVGTNGTVGGLTIAGNSINWLVSQPVAGPYSYQMAANGTLKVGAF